MGMPTGGALSIEERMQQAVNDPALATLCPGRARHALPAATQQREELRIAPR